MANTRKTGIEYWLEMIVEAITENTAAVRAQNDLIDERFPPQIEEIPDDGIHEDPIDPDPEETVGDGEE